MGDTNVVTVRILENGEFEFVDEQEGDTVADVLSYVEYDPKRLFVSFRETAEQAVRSNRISPRRERKLSRPMKPA